MACYDETIDEIYDILPEEECSFHCPVCGEKALQHTGGFEICPFCGWEDDGTVGEDEVSVFGANGEYSIRQYREEYKKQLFRVHPVPFEDLTREEKILPEWDWVYDDEENSDTKN